MNRLMKLLVLSSCLIGCNSEITKTATNQTNYDSQIVIDLKDNISNEEIVKFSQQYNLILHPAILFNETKEEIADIGDNNEEELLELLQEDPRVEIVEPLMEYYISGEPNDPLYKDQWGMKRMNASTAWNYSTGRGVITAVIDTGVACYNRNGFKKMDDLQAECVPGWNFIENNDLAADDNSHGSHVASTIAEAANNNLGGVGLAYNAKIMPVKVLAGNGSGSNAGVADGIRWAADHGAQIINMSLGGGPNSEIMQKSINYAISKGVVVIAAAGNSSGKIEYPGGSDGVIGVSASDENDKLARFSCRGDGIDISAPGTNILQQTIKGNGKEGFEYNSYSGTSMASPAVAGVATLIESLGTTEPKAVERVLFKTARDMKDKNLFGAGIVDAAAAVSYTVWHHGLVRIGLLFGLTFILSLLLKGKGTSPYSWKYLVPGFFAGPGLLFFLPLVLSCVSLPLDIASRALPDMDLIAGAAIHQYFPLANAVIPFLLMLLTWSFKQLRPAVAGLAVGMGAYLLSVVVLGDQFSQFGSTIQTIWCGLNVVGCMIIAKMNLSEAI